METIIALDIGNIRAVPSICRDQDMRTRLGGKCFDLLPPEQAAGGGIPTTVFYRENRGLLFGVDAESQRARPLSNRQNLLKNRLSHTVEIDGRKFSIDELFTGMVEHVVRIARKQLQDQYHIQSWKVAVAYPVTFNAARRQHMIKVIQSIEIDGRKLEVVGTITEPAAAALDYLAESGSRKEQQRVLVYDMGGGTFDCCILNAYINGRERENSRAKYYYDVEVQNGIPGAAGARINQLLEGIIRSKIDGELAQAADDMLSAVVENTKIELSRLQRSEPLIMDKNGDYCDIDITREELNDAIRPMIEETVQTMRSMLAEREPVDMIILTGGSSQIPLIQETIQRMLPEYEGKIACHRPSRAISFGTARFAVNEDALQQRTIFDLGVKYRDPDDDRYYIGTMLPAGTALPYVHTNENAEAVADTDSVSAEVYEAIIADPDEYNLEHWRLVTTIHVNLGKTVPEGTKFTDVLSIDKRNMLKIVSFQNDRRDETYTEGEIPYEALQ